MALGAKYWKAVSSAGGGVGASDRNLKVHRVSYTAYGAKISFPRIFRLSCINCYSTIALYTIHLPSFERAMGPL